MKQLRMVCLCMVTMLWAGVLSAQTLPWSAQTAYPTAKGRLESGILQGIRYGISSRVSLSTDLTGLLGPRVESRATWATYQRWHIATSLSLGYPTPLLRLVAREGTGGLMPADSRIPGFVSVSAGILATRRLSDHHWLTASSMIHGALRLGTRDMPTLDVPLLYPRTAAYHGGLTSHSGLRLDGGFTSRLAYGLSAHVWLQTRNGFMAFEQEGTLVWLAGDRFQPFAGARLVVGSYPFGAERHLIPIGGFRLVIRKGLSSGEASKPR